MATSSGRDGGRGRPKRWVARPAALEFVADKFPEVVSRLKSVLERFADALSCIDQCFIADEMLEQLPAASRVGKTIVGGIDLNKARMRRVIEALLALSSSPNGFTASEVAARVRALSKQSPSQYGPRHAAYDLKKLRGKHIIPRH